MMIGSSAMNLLYRTIEDVQSPEAYLDYMFGGMQGVVYRATIDQNRRQSYRHSYWRASNIGSATFSRVKDCYVSMNTYFRSKNMRPGVGRDEDHVKRLNACYVDIDCHKKGLSKEYVLAYLRHACFGQTIPVPTFVIDSGRGLYLIWKLQNEDRNAMTRWRAVQEYLVDALADVGADTKCVDASRILRVPGTINTKSNTAVQVLEFNDLTYTIYEIAREYDIKPKQKEQTKKQKMGVVYPYGQATAKQREYVRDLAKRLGLTEADYPDFANFQATDEWIKAHKAMVRPQKAITKKVKNRHPWTENRSMYSVLDGYCKDIYALLQMRNSEGSCRETGFFIIRSLLLGMGHTKEEALSKITKLNADLACPLPEAEITYATASAEKRQYRFRRTKIISMLDITREELQTLPHLASASKPTKEYRRAANRRAYESRLSAEGKVAKKDAVLQRRAEILTLQEQGKTAAEIRERLQISKATYHRDIAALRTESVLDAVRAFLRDQIEQIIDIAREAADDAKNSDIVAVIRAAAKKQNGLTKGLSHFFSILFDKNSFAVLPLLASGFDRLQEWLSSALGVDLGGSAAYG